MTFKFPIGSFEPQKPNSKVDGETISQNCHFDLPNRKWMKCTKLPNRMKADLIRVGKTAGGSNRWLPIRRNSSNRKETRKTGPICRESNAVPVGVDCV